MQEMKTYQLGDSELMKLPAIQFCPFCGATPYWLGILTNGRADVPHFYHPGVVTDKECILNGQGYSAHDAELWNRRAT